ncbi:DUF1552 domain-containing protein [Stratiformator vulcanicus]|uniref:DUF1552 domain-containing protein n=1 Tax=Stratiformator vulcanicus TaxID=2527980 RepID=A0A517R1Y2_9PLAN|nr:DUF1552 domain-containing protein [Stratiformator vulcanicus]QDT37878.1 hypothetical protein Pan189_22610 [Stratiformator vulcanicus]
MPIHRRTFLRGSSVALALPMLDAMQPRSATAAAKEDEQPRRMVCINTPLGYLPSDFFPETAGKNYESTRYLKSLDDLRGDFTVFSGVSHPDVSGGHHAAHSYLTAAPGPGGSSFRNTISLDQYIAERLPPETRYNFLTLAVGSDARSGLSWTSGGVRIPPVSSPANLYAKLFLQGKKDSVARQVRSLQDGQSIMDVIMERAKRMERSLGAGDRAKLDEYFTSVRTLEERLKQNEEWVHTPKPKVKMSKPENPDDRSVVYGRTELFLDLIHLAIQTDSTRVIAIEVGSGGRPPIKGVSMEHHNLTHHGKDPTKIEQLKLIEDEEMKVMARFLKKMKATSEKGETLLDRTMIQYGSNIGNAAAHSNTNIPMILAGGGFKHQGHLAFDNQKNTPLSNLYVSMLQRLGFETDSFGSSTGTMSGLEMTT